MKKLTRRCFSAPKTWYIVSPYHSCKVSARQKLLVVSLYMLYLTQIEIRTFQIIICKTSCCGRGTGFCITHQRPPAFFFYSTAVKKIRRSVLFCFSPGKCFLLHSENEHTQKTASMFFSFKFWKADSFFFKYYFSISSKVIHITTKRDQRKWFFFVTVK